MSEQIEQHFVDKSSWPDGAWRSEPDRVAFKHADFHCLVVRGPSGALCGYVAVPPGHPWHGKDYEEVGAIAHGGLTFASHCQEDREHGICHKPPPGEPENVWWLGFDCAHSGDVCPAHMYRREYVRDWETYKDLGYVMIETRQLAEQARDAA